ncbi:MAG: AGE family epimerase/isomerase [Geminicoccales bacterium]
MTYRASAFLRSQIKNIMTFYDPVVVDHDYGGFINQLKDDGSIYDRMTKHLVGTCRFIYNYATAAVVFGDDHYLDAAKHGIAFLQQHHRQEDGGYAWVLKGRDIEDGTRHCYGHAFVLLAVSAAAKAGVADAISAIDEIYALLEKRFWEADQQLYVDVIHEGDWTKIDSYRGQNANMHMCEAMLVAYEATRDIKYLDRAYQLAKKICVDLASKTDGMIWEHYRSNWSVDWDYNRDDPKNLFRPYGYLPGHFVEWAKLLIMLNRHRPESWMIERAKKLFAVAVDKAWDQDEGGFHYTFSPDGKVLDTDRYYWVMSEAIAAAALLGAETGDPAYWRWYDDFWAYSDRCLIDHNYGGWFRVLDIKGKTYDDLKSPPAKTDYHPLSACYTALQAIDAV